ncbi:SulP family inorganic anion transporter [Bhargavaea ginsengi]|uniref:SulP family inorganic anion transporter n=1 Tax=Bhargavaea ginsengi TaxID=426757 RepID=UPI003C738B09
MRNLGRFESLNGQTARKDILAGITVGIVAIPLGMAFAIASGVKPEYGIYTTVIAGLLVALLGGSRFQIAGPTGAFIPILLAIVLEYGYSDLLVAGFMAGIFLVIMSFLKIGDLIHFVPRAVTIGFTAGIAVTIFTGQIGNFFGLEGVERKEFFHENMWELLRNIGTFNGYAFLTAAIGLAVIIILPRIAPRVPLFLAALLIPTLVSVLFYPGHLPTIGTAYGGIPQQLPEFRLPEITGSKILELWQPALIIAALGAIESLLSAVVADNMAGGKKSASNRELFGQGIANMAAPLFGGIPATGAIARTATNIRAGAVSPLSGVVQSVFVLLVLLLFAPFASHVPLASMAPILMLVAWNMSGLRSFIKISHLKTGDSAVLWVTFLLTVFVNLTVGVQVGFLLAVLVFLKKMSGKLKVRPAEATPDDYIYSGIPKESSLRTARVEGPLFFGTAQVFEQEIEKLLETRSDVLMLRLHGLSALDAGGVAALSFAHDLAERQGVRLLFQGIPDEKKILLRKSGLYEKIGAENMVK